MAKPSGDHSTTVKLITEDEQEFEVEGKVANMMQTIKEMMEDLDGAEGEMVIPVSGVSSNILTKVLEYLKHHVDDEVVEKKEDDVVVKQHDSKIEGWDAEFVKMEQPELFETILAANYLNVKSLLDLCCKAVANMIKGKDPEEIRKTFGIANDFTPEEEAQVRKENEWVD